MHRILLRAAPRLPKVAVWLFLCSLMGGAFPIALSAQQEHQQWFFGYGAALDFASGAPQPLASSAMNTDEGCSSICDATGNLLFYTDGVTVWNRNHQPMPNGTGLHGGTSATQSALITQVPGADSLYLVFTVPAQVQGGYTGLSYSIIDMTLQGGLGDLTIKNTSLCDSTTEKLTATRASNGTDVWVVTHRWDSDAFYAYRVTCLVSGQPQVIGPVISLVGSVHAPDPILDGTSTSLGCMSISPDGHRLALVWSRYRNATSPDSDASLEWFDFDPATGVVSSPASLDIPGLRAYGCAFSPSSRYLYVTTYGLMGGIAYSDIRQYDLQAPDVQASEAIVQAGNPEFGALQLGPDRRMYVARLSFSPYISAIPLPDSAAPACGYLNQAATLATGDGSTWGLPNHWDHFIPPQVWTFQDTSICPWESLTLSADVLGATGWLWSTGSATATTTLTDSGEVTVQVFLDCDTLRDTFHLRYRYCDPMILPSNAAEICDGDGIHLDATQPTATAYHWRFGETTPAIFTADTGWIWVDVSLPNGPLRDSIYLTHRDCDCVVAHNVFTPNGDGFNDRFQPRVDCELETYHLTVFDRWGKLLFDTRNPTDAWAGMVRGNPAPESVYYYIVDWKQHHERQQQTLGSLILMR